VETHELLPHLNEFATAICATTSVDVELQFVERLLGGLGPQEIQTAAKQEAPACAGNGSPRDIPKCSHTVNGSLQSSTSDDQDDKSHTNRELHVRIRGSRGGGVASSEVVYGVIADERRGVVM
jgi:hypothetical protein